MTPSNPTFRGACLKDVLAEANQYVRDNGEVHASSRGRTSSLGAVTLVWDGPADTPDTHWSWPGDAANFYQQVFVEDKPDNAPERLAAGENLVFPYTYAARSRFWDGGWGYVLAVVQATRTVCGADGSFPKSEPAFRRYLEEAGELVHLQPLLAVWDWLGAKQMAAFIQEPEIVQAFLRRARIDQLERIIQEIGQNSTSRRAVTASFVYPEIDQRLQPVQGIPPYQFFQLLPGEAGEALSSFHVHRSLDAGGGVQLDFMHDYHWLEHACRTLGRPLGTITVVAANYHVYWDTPEAPSMTDVTAWLLGVTDGYRTGQGAPAALLENDFYRQNLHRIFNSFTE